MQEKDLRPSTKQRLIFALVAAILLGSSIAAYVLIVMGNGTVNYSKMNMEQLQTAYSEKSAELDAEAKNMSDQYFEEFKSYKKNVKAFNSSKANSGGVTHTDLKEGSGDEIGNSGYAAYYIGWCANEEIFDSSFDDYDEPTALKAPISVSESSLIEGWYLGMEGTQLGGVREITIPGSLAYGESMEICGDKNSPLKFIVMPVEETENFKKLNSELSEIYTALSNAYTQAYSSSSTSDYDYDTETYEDTETTTGE